MKDRIKALRRFYGLTQQEFADRINIKRGTLASYEVGRVTPIDAVFSLICREFHCSEDWLRYGTGEMISPTKRSDEIAEFVADVLSDEPESFRQRLVSMLARLNSDEWEWLEEKARELVSGKETKKEQDGE